MVVPKMVCFSNYYVNVRYQCRQLNCQFPLDNHRARLTETGLTV